VITRHAIRAGEYLAIDPSYIQHDADGFFFFGSPESPENDQSGTVTIVHIRGALCHYRGDGGDSYEAIVERITAAFQGDPKPSAVVLRIESPGGVVAGLNETVFKLQRMSKAAGIPLVAYVDEMAASAAYALCCACSEVLAPPSAVIGSIGTISTMVSVAKRDAIEGIEFRIITSGKRKSDGHPHVQITEDAVRAETLRNEELSAQFFALAGKARRIPPKRLASLQAAIYLGRDAEKVGLIDDVMSLDDALLGLDASEVSSTEPVAPNDGNLTDRRAKPAQSGSKRPTAA
jgi:signal peptide peptidase SppA